MRLFQLCLLCVIAITVKADENECLFNDGCTGDAKCIEFKDDNNLMAPGVYKCESTCIGNDDCSAGSECINHRYAAILTCSSLNATACEAQDQCTSFYGRQRRTHGMPGGHNDTGNGTNGNETNGNETDVSNCQYTGGGNNVSYVQTCLTVCNPFYKKDENGECVFDNHCENTIPPCPHTSKTQCYHIANGEQLQCLCLHPERGLEVANDCECPSFLSPDKNSVCTMPGYTVIQTFEGSDNGYVTEQEGTNDGDTVLQNSYLNLALYPENNTLSQSLPDSTSSVSFNVKFADSGVVDARFTLDNNENVRVHIELGSTHNDSTSEHLITTLFFADTPDSNSTAVYSNQIELNKWYTISVVLSHATHDKTMMDITVNVDNLTPNAKILSLQSPLNEFTYSGNGSVDNLGYKQDNTFVPASDQLTNFDFSKLQCTDTDNCPIKDVTEFSVGGDDSLLYTPDKVIDIKSKDAEFFMEYSTTEDTLNYTFVNSNDISLDLSFKKDAVTACGQEYALKTSFDIKQRFVVMIKFPSFLTSDLLVSVNSNEEISVNCTNSPFWTLQDVAKAIVVQNYTHTQLHGFSVNGKYKEPTTTPIPATVAPTKKKKTGTIVGGIVGGIVGVGVVIIVLLKRKELKEFIGLGADFPDKSVLDQLIL
jgi:hypothetical protein